MMDTNTLTVFENLVDQYSREIFGYLWRTMQDHQDAEDALQESFLRAYRAFPKLANHANLRAWLYKIATNVANTSAKKRQRQEQHLSKLMTTHHSAPLTDEIGDNLVRREQLEAVIQAVSRLPDKQRAALMLRNYQGLAYQEIAIILNCSEDSARANVYQALKKLRREFPEGTA